MGARERSRGLLIAPAPLAELYVSGQYNGVMSTITEHQGRGRINIRVAPEQEARIRAAAEANGESLTGFLLAAAITRAEEVLKRESRITVDLATFQRFVAALDQPPKPMPTLSRYAKQAVQRPPR
jgi:uncharacterized protein (DUF1778 family)